MLSILIGLTEIIAFFHGIIYLYYIYHVKFICIFLLCQKKKSIYKTVCILYQPYYYGILSTKTLYIYTKNKN